MDANRAAGQAMRSINNGNNSRYGDQKDVRQQYREAFIRGIRKATTATTTEITAMTTEEIIVIRSIINK